MVLNAWLFQHSKSVPNQGHASVDEVTPSRLPPKVLNAVSKSLHNFNFREVLNSHHRWKLEFEHSVKTACSRLNRECYAGIEPSVLWLWLAKISQTAVGQLPAFQLVKEEYEQFHDIADQVCQLVTQGLNDQALQIMENEYLSSSHDLIVYLAELYMEWEQHLGHKPLSDNET